MHEFMNIVHACLWVCDQTNERTTERIHAQTHAYAHMLNKFDLCFVCPFRMQNLHTFEYGNFVLLLYEFRSNFKHMCVRAHTARDYLRVFVRTCMSVRPYVLFITIIIIIIGKEYFQHHTSLSNTY